MDKPKIRCVNGMIDGVFGDEQSFHVTQSLLNVLIRLNLPSWETWKVLKSGV